MGYPPRRAALRVTSQIMGDLGPLLDHGLAIIGSLDSDPARREPVLVLEGDGLPDICAAPGPLQVVTVHFSQEAYGRQRMVRVRQIEPTGLTVANIDVRINSDGTDVFADPAASDARVPLN